MHVAFPIAALLCGLFALYQSVRSYRARKRTGSTYWAGIRLSLFGSALGWSVICAAAGSFAGALAVWAACFTYSMYADNHRREGYAILGMAASLMAAWWAYLQPAAKAVVGAL